MKTTAGLDWSFDRGFGVRVCGVDEAGRGPLAGSVVAAACILKPDAYIEGLNDSKKLSEKKRELIYDEIISSAALAYGIAEATCEEIDELNILNATMLAMRRAIAAMGVTPELALIDGDKARGFDIPTRTVISGDAISPSIAAASILAKVTRDRMCIEYDRLYPEYGIAKHKGYPTAEHKRAVMEHGPSPIHRKTFLKFYYGQK